MTSRLRAQHRIRLVDDSTVIVAVQAARAMAMGLGFDAVSQAAIAISVSEIASNVVRHAGSGVLHLKVVLAPDSTPGIEAVAEDSGPGIGDIQAALEAGVSTAGGLGIGLAGAKRLSDEFEIDSSPGCGTKVRIVRWRSSEPLPGSDR